MWLVVELHFESMAVIEDENKDLVAVHELPRRATVVSSTHPAVAFSDYLFESDSAHDACESFRDLLGLNESPG